jgi:hypothetical protein
MSLLVGDWQGRRRIDPAPPVLSPPLPSPENYSYVLQLVGHEVVG